MASSEYGSPDEMELVLEEADVYKATSSNNYVVLRRVKLYKNYFLTFHNIAENEEVFKRWLLTAQCDLHPKYEIDIKEPCIKYVRPRGQWAITTLVKPKAIGSKGHSVRLYMFTLNWPTRWAAKGYSSFSFGFTTLDAAHTWHRRLSDCILSIRADKSSTPTQSLTPPSLANGRMSNTGMTSNPTSAPVPTAPSSETSVATVPKASHKRTGSGPSALGLVPGLPKAFSMGGGRVSRESFSEAPSQMGSPASAQNMRRPSMEHARRPSAPEPAKRSLVYDNVREASVPVGAASSAVASHTNTSGSAAAAPAVMQPPPQPPQPQPPPMHLDGVFSRSSSDSDGEEEEADCSHRAGGRGSNVVLGSGAGPCRGLRGNTRGDVRHSIQRWVPYKQVNGVAIYHRPQTAGDAEAGVGGEFMVSTVVRGSPRRCLTVLTSNCGNTTVLGPALTLEVLQRRQAVDGKEIQRIILQAPGITGVICAPRELVVETVFKTDETGPTLVLMFNSCEPPARFVERRPGEAPEQDEGDSVQATSEGGPRSWWRRPMAARVRGGYTMAPLEECSLDNSPEALVTCVMKVDLGGVCGERSWLRLGAELVGWRDAFLDRMLMAVTLLRDEVEQGRFVVQPLSIMASSSRVKDRDGSIPEPPPSLGLGLLCGRNADAGPVPGAGGSGVGTAAGGTRKALRGPTSNRNTVRESRSNRRETVQERPSLVDATTASEANAAAGVEGAASLGEALPGGAATSGTAEGGAAVVLTAAGGAFAHGEGARAAAATAAGCVDADADGATDTDWGTLTPSPSGQQYESMEDVLLRMRSLSFLDTKVWDNLHQPGKDAPFKIRGPTYLKDRKKIPAGNSRFVLGSMDVIELPPGPVTEHVARFIPAIRESGAPFSVVVHLVIPGTPLLGIVATFVTDRHPSTMGPPPAHPMEEDHDWEPFQFVLHKYLTGSTHTRNHMLKLIPHIADGSWMIKQSVGTTPVILGKQLRTIYYETPQYIEIDIDISANNVASYVTGLVRGATRSLVIDMGFVLESTTPWELPEALLGTLRLYHLDIKTAHRIDTSREIPLRPCNLLPPQLSPAPLSAGAPSLPNSAGLLRSVSHGHSTPGIPGHLAAVSAPASVTGNGNQANGCCVQESGNNTNSVNKNSSCTLAAVGGGGCGGAVSNGGAGGGAPGVVVCLPSVGAPETPRSSPPSGVNGVDRNITAAPALSGATLDATPSKR